MPQEIHAGHVEPIWRERANFLIHADLTDAGWAHHWEQLWARQLGEDRFEVCCIPFFAYNLALGDEVVTKIVGENRYVVDRVVRPSGRYVFRVSFRNSPEPDALRDEVAQHLRGLGCLIEWYSHELLAVDAVSERSQAVADYLWGKEQRGELVYETGLDSPR